MTAHSPTIAAQRGLIREPGRRTYVIATVVTAAGMVAIATLLIVGILLAMPTSSHGAAPAPEPLPHPVLQVGAGR